MSSSKSSLRKSEKLGVITENHGDDDEDDGAAQVEDGIVLKEPIKLTARDLISLSTTNQCCLASRGRRILCALFLVTAIVLIVAGVVWKVNTGDETSDEGIGSIYIMTTAPPTAAAAEIPGTLHEIYKRGRLRCGVWKEVGRAVLNKTTNQLEGFSVDLCRTIAAAIFGADNVSLELVVVEAENRFEVLQAGDVDVLSSWDTYTMERDVFEPTSGAGLSFSVPYFYDGMAFAGLPTSVSCATGPNATNCGGLLKFCTLEGSTYVTMLQTMFPGLLLSTSLDYKGVFRNFFNGGCNVLVGDQFVLAESVMRATGYTGEYLVADSVVTHEPLALVTRDDDAQWSDFVNWIVEALLTSEDIGATQLQSFNAFEKTDLFGKEFRNMFVDALSTSGNYGELYERHLEVLVPRANINKINKGTSGLMYSYPFGETEAEGPDVALSGTIAEILERGYLRCGVTNTVIFGMRNDTTNEWSGLDIDFCRALSAALFDGVTSTVEFIETTTVERFMALQNGTVDVLSRVTTVTYSRDVKEKTSQKGLTFARPNFYDGLGFGGIPPFHECADNLDVLSEQCQALKICVQSGTTFLTIMEGLVSQRILVPILETGDVPAGLRTGACNVIAGGASDIAKSNIIEFGQYTGPYATGTKRFSNDPLTLVTREDDPQWSSFVFWTVMAVFYAEEEGISMDTAASMPTTNIFGPRFTKYFQNIVKAVGSYADIYERNVQNEVSRGATGLLNSYPYGPQHFPLPGLPVPG